MVSRPTTVVPAPVTVTEYVVTSGKVGFACGAKVARQATTPGEEMLVAVPVKVKTAMFSLPVFGSVAPAQLNETVPGAPAAVSPVVGKTVGDPMAEMVTLLSNVKVNVCAVNEPAVNRICSNASAEELTGNSPGFTEKVGVAADCACAPPLARTRAATVAA